MQEIVLLFNRLYEKWTNEYYQNGICEYNRLTKAIRIDETAAVCKTYRRDRTMKIIDRAFGMRG